MTYIFINTILTGLLIWTCFCRLVRTSGETYISIRAAFWVLTIASLACMLAPFRCGLIPQCPQLTIEAAMVVVQGLTARFWRDGVPCHFQRPPESNEVHP